MGIHVGKELGVIALEEQPLFGLELQAGDLEDLVKRAEHVCHENKRDRAGDHKTHGAYGVAEH
jgi:hypothetical protein